MRGPARSLTQPPADQIAQFRVAELMASRIGPEGHAPEPQGREASGGFFDERDRAIRVLLTGGKPGGHAPRADSSWKDATVQHRHVRERGPVAPDVRSAAAATRIPGDQHARGVDDETQMHPHPLDAVERVREIRSHVSRVIANLPGERAGRAAARIRSHDGKAAGLDEGAKGGKDAIARSPGAVQDYQKGNGL